jgi:hypothetical protein
MGNHSNPGLYIKKLLPPDLLLMDEVSAAPYSKMGVRSSGFVLHWMYTTPPTSNNKGAGVVRRPPRKYVESQRTFTNCM